MTECILEGRPLQDLPQPHTRPPRRSQQERSSAMRAALVAAAIECIADLGYAGTTTPAVARRAGVSRGALQHHFAARDDLILAVIDHVMTALNFSFDPAALATHPLDVRLDFLLDHYRRVFGSRAFAAALGIWLGVAAEPVLLHRMRRHLRGAQAAMGATWLSAFRDTGLDHGTLQSVRRIVMATLRGYAVNRIFRPGATDWAQDGAVLRRMVLSYIATGDGAARRPA